MANSVDESTTMTLSPSSRHITGGGFAFFESVPQCLFSRALLGFFCFEDTHLSLHRLVRARLHLVLFLGRGAAFFLPSLDGLGLIVSHLGASDRNQSRSRTLHWDRRFGSRGHSLRYHSGASEGLEDD